MFGLALGAAEAILREKQRAYKKREYNKYIAIYRQTNTQYNLGIPDNILHNSADRYADLNAKRAYPTISGVVSAMFNSKNIWKTITNILGAIAGIVLSIFPPTAVAGWVMVAGVVSSIIGGVTALTLQVLEIKSTQMLEFRSKQISSLGKGTHLQQEHLKAMNQQITDLLIYNPYAMFPEGELYKQDRAGSIGYQAGLEAPNPMRAINGVHSTNALAKQLTNTAHTSLPGNKDYNPNPLPFPTQDFKENAKFVKEGIMADVKAHATQIQKGFSILAENYFCFDDESTFKSHFDRNIRERVNPRILRFNCYSFIEQNKYYSKGERLPRFYHQLLPSQLKYKGLPKFDDAPLVFVSSIKYDMGQDVLSATRVDVDYSVGDMTSPQKIGDSWAFKTMLEISKALKDMSYWKYNGWFHKNKIEIYYRNFTTELEYEDIFHKERYEEAVENARITMQERIKNYFNTYYAMLFMLGTSGEVLHSIYALKAEVEQILEGKSPSTKEKRVVDDGEWYAILVAKVKKDKINNDFTSGIQCDKIENFGKGTDAKSANLPQNLQSYHSNTANLNHTQNPQEAETTQSGRIFEIESGLSSEPTRSLLNINDAVGERRIADSSQKDNAKAKTSPTRDKITLQELRALKQATLDLYNPPKIPLWDYYDVEIMSVTSNAKAVPSVAESAKKKFDIKDDDFVLFGINEPMLETYDFELEKTPKQWQEANTLLYSFVTYQAQKTQKD